MRIIDWFESLAPDDVAQLGEYYAEGVRFKDPFNEVQGTTEVQRIFTHMFAALAEPRFVIRDVVAQGDQCFLTWDFTFRFKRLRLGLQTVHGASHLKLDSQGHITLHRDYWDAAEEMYEKLPALGALMRWLKKRAKA
jgi:hypothetical protein